MQLCTEQLHIGDKITCRLHWFPGIWRFWGTILVVNRYILRFRLRWRILLQLCRELSRANLRRHGFSVPCVTRGKNRCCLVRHIGYIGQKLEQRVQFFFKRQPTSHRNVAASIRFWNTSSLGGSDLARRLIRFNSRAGEGVWPKTTRWANCGWIVVLTTVVTNCGTLVAGIEYVYDESTYWSQPRFLLAGVSY